MTAVREDAPSTTPPTYAHLQSAARHLFEPDELERLVPRLRGGPRLAEVNGQGAAALDPIAATEAIAYDFLAKGGKYSRPFITLAAYDALTGGHCTRPTAMRTPAGSQTQSAARPSRSSPFTKRRSCTTTFRTATIFATASRRCTSSMAFPRQSTLAII